MQFHHTIQEFNQKQWNWNFSGPPNLALFWVVEEISWFSTFRKVKITYHKHEWFYLKDIDNENWHALLS